jgi:hypothetical protein
MKTTIVLLSSLGILLLSGCEAQIEYYVRGPDRDGVNPHIVTPAHQKEFVAGKQDIVLGSGYRIQATLGAPVGTIQNTSSGGYKLFHTVQGSISGN